MQLFNVRNAFRPLLAAAALAVVVASSPAQAGMVTGSQGFNFSGITTNQGPILADEWIKTATSFNFTGIKTNDVSSDDFTIIASGTAADSGGTSVLDTTTYSFSFGNSSFGTFTSTGLDISDGGDIASNTSRTINLYGTFTGGTAFGSLNTPTPVVMTISLTQAGGKGHSISGSFSMATQAVPEPTSVGMMGLGLIATLGLGRLRRKSA